MKIVILANDNVAYSGILSYPILKKFSNEISGIFIQDGILNSNTNHLDLFNKVKKKSGLQFAIFLVLETIYYRIAVTIRRIFSMNKHLGVFNNPNINTHSCTLCMSHAPYVGIIFIGCYTD